MTRSKLLAVAAPLLLVGIATFLYLSDTDDARLVNAVRRAKDRRLQPHQVEEYVGKQATINTVRPGDADSLSVAEFDEDERSPVLDWLVKRPSSVSRLHSAKHVVYWVRSLEDRFGNPRIVGILWQADGTVETFEAVVLPP